MAAGPGPPPDPRILEGRSAPGLPDQPECVRGGYQAPGPVPESHFPGEAQPMTPEPPLEKAADAMTIVKALRQNAHDAIALQAMLSGINDNEPFRSLFNNTYEGHGLNTVYHALLRQLVVALTRIYDPPTKNRASLPRLMQLLEERPLVGLFVELARRWIIGIDRLEKINAYRAAKAILRARRRYKRLVESDEGKTWLRTLKEFRDHHLVHSLFNLNEGDRVQYGYIGDLLDRTMPIIDDLQFGIEGVNRDRNEDRAEEQARAESFWKVVANGMPPAR